jgi:transcriptional regulator with XRE-family HTH domain
MTVLLREAIGERLRRTRTDQRRTLREVSRSARVSLGYLSEVERGRKEPSSELLAAICDALALPLPQLLDNVASDMRGPETLRPAVPAAATESAITNSDGALVGPPSDTMLSELIDAEMIDPALLDVDTDLLLQPTLTHRLTMSITDSRDRPAGRGRVFAA